jgi:CheY-like chemotaxis protein
VDGFEAAAAIRARQKTAGGHLPIVAMTAHAVVSNRERCVAAGMDGYLPKPIAPTTMAEEIRRVLSLRFCQSIVLGHLRSAIEHESPNQLRWSRLAR